MKRKSLPSLSADAALRKLGSDIATARKRRRLTQSRVADGAGVSVPTIRNLEAGDPGVSVGTLAMVLLVLGETSRLSDLLDAGEDDVGLLLSEQQLPKRIRSSRRSAATSAGTDDAPDGEAF
ncbi:helix-turn-helix transcriptional regulator [Amorphus sp. 3PC139-8]|uniref:helix-turn-helix transcriptional regulator n=1 Tax=Amorphus sp. 3PC139-8 TaxID=2735676 RepID=UPI00345D596F